MTVPGVAVRRRVARSDGRVAGVRRAVARVPADVEDEGRRARSVRLRSCDALGVRLDLPRSVAVARGPRVVRAADVT